ncbi:hypothetical protein VNO80_06251 [Phaseolus coccineus]|uniref:Uncharacterized protein n=1 Tax=Phaseolus coccineus TaxID=3886 RepID=A0AAN9NLA6_PHACN
MRKKKTRRHHPPTLSRVKLEEVLKFQQHVGENLVQESIADNDEVLEVLAVSKVVGDVAEDVGVGGD